MQLERVHPNCEFDSILCFDYVYSRLCETAVGLTLTFMGFLKASKQLFSASTCVNFSLHKI